MYAHHLPFALLDALCRASHAESSHTIFESQIAEFDASTFAYWMMKLAYPRKYALIVILLHMSSQKIIS